MRGVFRIFYSTTYTVVFLVLVLLLAVTPGDTIYQSIRDSQLQNVFIVAGAYILAGLLVFFVYGSRLYTSRTVLAAIPKSYVPIEAVDVGPKVQHMIAKQLERSALIAWNSRPRDIQAEIEHAQAASETQLNIVKTPKISYKDDEIHSLLQGARLLFDPYSPPWRVFEHPGWSSPTCDDFPSLQYSKVINELPHLIEAKAFSLAVPGTEQITQVSCDPAEQYAPDQRIFSILHRSASMDLRDYLAQLILLEVITDEDAAVQFTAHYEFAHYSDEDLTEPQFRDLMESFSSVLSSMVEIQQSDLKQILDENRKLRKDSNTSTISSLSRKSTNHRRLPIYARDFERSSRVGGEEIGATFSSKSVRQETNDPNDFIISTPLASNLSLLPPSTEGSIREMDNPKSNSLSMTSIRSHQSVVRRSLSIEQNETSFSFSDNEH